MAMRWLPRQSRRRGAALLIVLAALILVATASATLVRLASSVKLSGDFNVRIVRADDLLGAVDQPIQHWLKTRSQEIVLPIDSKQPSVDVLNDLIKEGTEQVTIRIRAFDQCGMAPIELARSGSPIRLALPESIAARLDALVLSPNQKPGLDLFAEDSDDQTRIFPDPSEATPTVHSSEPDAHVNAANHTNTTESRLAVGAWVATHSPGLINVNTAPMELVEAAIKSAVGGDLEQVRDARSKGQLAAAPSLSASVDSRESVQIRLTSVSPCWSFRIDIEVGPLRRSWWAVYMARQGGGSEWECVQRLAITE